MNREKFLLLFLSVLGAQRVDFFDVSDECVKGRVIYDINDPVEIQDFCWDAKECDVPDESVIKLLMLLEKHKLVDIDKISITREQLLDRYNEEYSTLMSKCDFDCTIEPLLSINVWMVDEGKKTDFFFIHE